MVGGHTVAAQDASMVEERWSVGGLAGTFAGPANAPARGPAVLIIAGSGPTPRDGSFATYAQLAQGLAAAGIRSLRYDKRGVGDSRALFTREDDLVLQTFVDDALTAARDLKARADVSSLVLVGHSEGALIATLAASQAELAGIVLLAGPGRRLDAILREQLLAMPVPAEQEHYRQEGLAILQKLTNGERVNSMSPPQAPLFRPSVQPFLLSVFAVDPAAALARLTLPVLIVQAASDIQVSLMDFEALRRARPDARTLLLPEANHEFKPAPADIRDRAAQIKSYDRTAPLVAGLVPAVVDFVRSVAP